MGSATMRGYGQPNLADSTALRRVFAAQAIDLTGASISKLAVVKTKAIFIVGVLRIIDGRHVFARHDSQEGRQGAPLLEPFREQARERWTRGAAARAVSWRDQLFAGAGVAQVDRGARRGRRSAAQLGAVSGRSLRRRAARCACGGAAAVAGATEPTAAMGCVLAGGAAVGRTAARSFLERPTAGEPQGHALGSGAVGARSLPTDRARRGVALAARVVRPQRDGGFAR